MSVLLTTHVLAEAERCDRVGIVDRGRVVAIDTPDALKRRVLGHPGAERPLDHADVPRRKH